mgnify:CR=1 FL=1
MNRRKHDPTRLRSGPVPRRGSNSAALRKERPRPSASVPPREFSLYEPTPTPRELFADEDVSDGRRRRSRGPAVKDEQKQRLELASLQQLAHSGETAVLTGKAEGQLVVEQGAHKGVSVDLSEGRCTIGRSSKCTLALRLGSGISRQHAQVLFIDGLYYLEDLGSRNGTVLNGRLVEGQVVLRDRDLIEVSQERLRFYGPMPDGEDHELPPDAAIQQALFDQAFVDEATPPKRPKKRKKKKGSKKNKLHNRSHIERVSNSGKQRVLQATHEDVGERIEASIESGSVPRAVAPGVELSSSVPTALPHPHDGKKRRAGLVAFGGLVGLFIALGLIVAWDTSLNDGALLDEVMGAKTAEPTAVAPGGPAADAPTLDDIQIGDESTGDEAKAPTADTPTADAKTEASAEAAPPADAPPAAADTAAAAAPVVEAAPVAQVQPIQVRAGASGKVTKVLVAVGDDVKEGQTLVRYRKKPSGRLARKLQALKAEERDFAVYAKKGNAMAKESLREVRGRIRSLEKKLNKTLEVKAPQAGKVQKVLVRKGKAVRAKAPVVELLP